MSDLDNRLDAILEQAIVQTRTRIAEAMKGLPQVRVSLAPPPPKEGE
jgi:hypothetical protein